MIIKIIKNTIDTLPHIARFVLVGIIVLVISFLFPNKLEFVYKYDQGSRWEYEDLRAPFSFAIQKTPDELEREKKDLDHRIHYYYRFNEAVGKLQKEAFIQNFAIQLPLYLAKDSTTKVDSSRYVQFGLSFITSIYSRKYIRLQDEHKEIENFKFNLLDGHVDLGRFKPNDLLTRKEALQLLVDTLDNVQKKLPDYKFMFSILENTLETPNVVFDSIFTTTTQQQAINNISPSLGMVNIGELIAERGQLIDSVTYTKIVSYQQKYKAEINQHKNKYIIYFGYLLLTGILIGIFVLFTRFYARSVYNNIRHLALLLFLITGYIYLAHFVDQTPYLNMYLVPFCILPIIILNFFRPRLALFAHTVMILLISLILSLDYQFILIQMLVGMVAVVSKLKTRHLSNYFISLLYIGATYAIGFLSLEMVHTGTFLTIKSDYGTIVEKGIEWTMLWWVFLNVLLTLLSYPLIPILEKLFGLTSDITLVELSDMDNPLLKELSLKAQGTLQHSLQVANLSEAAAKEIGANALLVKVAAMYHDIGKMQNPTYFIENQNEENPHDQLSCLESTQMIIGHVIEGVKLAKKHRLPPVLIDFIRTHHGTTRVEYFYRTYLKEEGNPTNPTIAECEFRYPGPKPWTKEQAIMMMADSLEAASKSLKNPTGVDINNLVDNIIKHKIDLGQFQDTRLSFRELEQIKVVFKKLLKSINHVRIEYPDEQKKEAT